jgi:hypothetical protein
MTDAKSKGRASSRRKKEPDTAVAGRKRVIDTPEKFDELVDGYLAICRATTPPTPITLTGMILALGLTSKEGFYHYATYEGFEESVSRARLLIEHEYEKRLHGPNYIGALFGLKNFGWHDRPPTELERLQIEKLKKELDNSTDSLADVFKQLAEKLPG